MNTFQQDRLEMKALAKYLRSLMPYESDDQIARKLHDIYLEGKEAGIKEVEENLIKLATSS